MTILLAKNGRMSAGKNSKHIKNRFFLITDKIAQGDLEVRWCSTKEMRADINTKPLQGELFRVFRADMMGVPVNYDDDVERRRTHPQLLPKIEDGVVSDQDREILENVGVTTSRPTGKTQGVQKGSVSARRVPTPKRRSVLGEGKYGRGSGPLWNQGGTRYPALYKALLEEPMASRRREMVKSHWHAVEASQGVRKVSRPVMEQ